MGIEFGSYRRLWPLAKKELKQEVDGMTEEQFILWMLNKKTAQGGSRTEEQVIGHQLTAERLLHDPGVYVRLFPPMLQELAKTRINIPCEMLVWPYPIYEIRLPVPRPLAQAVAAGNFGHDERGPVNPSADEVREITENHAETLIDLLGEQKQAERTGREADQVRISVEVQAAVMKYAEDFGERAAEQLLAYCRRQNLINASSWNAPGHRRR